MLLLWPTWLLALLPWGVLFAWLLIGRPRRLDVPFLPLWSGVHADGDSKRQIQAPPLYLLAILAAIFCAIVAAALPVMAWRTHRHMPVTLVVDHGITMSALVGDQPRWVALARQVYPLLSKWVGADTPVHLVLLPGVQMDSMSLGQAMDRIVHAPPSTLTVDRAVAQAIQDRLASSGENVIAITDQNLPIVSPRLAQIAPTTAVQNVGILRAGASRGQLMLSLRNESVRTRVRLLIESASQSQVIERPLGVGEQNLFFDVPMGDSIKARLLDRDDLPADDSIELTPARLRPRPTTVLPRPLVRLLAAYQSVRDNGSFNGTVSVGTTLPENLSPAIVVGAGVAETGDQGAIRLAVHPINENLDAGSLGHLSVVGQPPLGWTPIIWLGEQIAVAVREQPTRAAWVGLVGEGWEREPGYVIFWTNILDWVSLSHDRFQSAGVDAQFMPVKRIDYADRIAHWSDKNVIQTPVGFATLVIAIACVALAAGTWSAVA